MFLFPLVVTTGTGFFLGWWLAHEHYEDLGPAHGEQDLQLHALHNKTQVVGCYSPCGALSFGQWGSRQPANS